MLTLGAIGGAAVASAVRRRACQRPLRKTRRLGAADRPGAWPGCWPPAFGDPDDDGGAVDLGASARRRRVFGGFTPGGTGA
jgi:hypothetical protein